MIRLPLKRKKRSQTKEKDNRHGSELDPGMQIDVVEIEIEDVTMRLKRKINLQVPHEVSAFIPRAEIRRREFEAGQMVREKEIILNSITIVHAPRHPLANESPPESYGQVIPAVPQNLPKFRHSYSKSDFSPKINWQFTSSR